MTDLIQRFEALVLENFLLRGQLAQAAQELDAACAATEPDAPCPNCGQTDEGQYGEYPCEACGLPTVWDEPALEAEDA